MIHWSLGHSSSYVFLEVKYLMLCVVKVFFLNFVPRMHSISLTKCNVSVLKYLMLCSEGFFQIKRCGLFFNRYVALLVNVLFLSKVLFFL